MKESDKSTFVLGINFFKIEGKEHDYKLNTVNSGVPTEVLIMTLRSLVKNYENKYFEDFNNKLMK